MLSSRNIFRVLIAVLAMFCVGQIASASVTQANQPIVDDSLTEADKQWLLTDATGRNVFLHIFMSGALVRIDLTGGPATDPIRLADDLASSSVSAVNGQRTVQWSPAKYPVAELT